MTSRRHLMLGLFFLVTLSVLAGYTLFLTDFDPFGDQQEMVVYFEDANGLREGNSVLVAGIRAGRVKTLTYDPEAPDERRVEAVLLMEHVLELHDDFSIEIEDATLLGGKQIAIDPGTGSAPFIEPRDEYFGTVSGGPLDGLGELVDENRERFEAILANIEGVTTDVRAGRGLIGRALSDDTLAEDVAGAVSEIRATAANARALTDEVRQGNGTLARLIRDEELYGEIEAIGQGLRAVLDDLQVVSADLREGKGTLGGLLRDEAMAEDVRVALADVRAIADRINAGEGTLGRLVVDDAIASDVQEITRRLREGDGTLGKLLTEDELYDRLAQVSADLQKASSAIAEGRGTLGRLLVEDEVYEDLRKALAVVTRSLEEFREAAPVTTFTSVIFGAF